MPGAPHGAADSREVAYVASRDARPRRALRITLAIVVALLAVLLGILSATLHSRYAPRRVQSNRSRCGGGVFCVC
jgi:hypothetical protein